MVSIRRPLLGGLILLAAIPVQDARARQHENVPVEVPRITSEVVIDGRIHGAEWARAEVRTLADGSVLRLQHDGRHLFVGISAARSGFPSLCLALGDSVRVLHASAALGSVSYGMAGESWTTRDTAFSYGMRNPDTTAAARAERAAYLSRHGWVSTTFGMSRGMQHEMQIALGLPAVRAALGYFVPQPSTWSIEAWPSPGEPMGCAQPDLVRGQVPPRLQFRPAEWAELRLTAP
jgi:hypothetical protein